MTTVPGTSSFGAGPAGAPRALASPGARPRRRRRPTPAGPAARAYLLRSAESLAEAASTAGVPARYALAQVAALRAATAVLATRAHPAPDSRRSRQLSVWVLLCDVAPELGEWADFFAAVSARHGAAGGLGAVTGREADDLLRDAERFLHVVERALRPVRTQRGLTGVLGPLRAPAGRLRLLPPVRRVPPRRARRTRGGARHGHARAHRPRRRLRRGQVRQGLPHRRDQPGARRRPRGRADRADLVGGSGLPGHAGPPRRSPVRGRRLPRARGCPGSPSWPAAGPGWAALCRLVSAVHLAGERGRAGRDRSTCVAEHAERRGSWCCSARPPRSGARVTRRRDDLARAALAPWRAVVPRRPAVVELVSHRLGAAATGAGHVPHAARMPASPSSAGLADGAHQRRALRRPARRAHRRRPRRRPAAGRRSTCATSTGATPRASSSPASRCTRSPRRSAGSPALDATHGEARRLLAAHPRGRRPVRARPARATSAWARCTSPSSSCRDRRGDRSRAGRRRAARPLRGGDRAAATARRRGSGSGSGSTTSSR